MKIKFDPVLKKLRQSDEGTAESIAWANVTDKPANASNAEITTGTEAGARIVSPAQMKLAVDTHGQSGMEALKMTAKILYGGL